MNMTGAHWSQIIIIYSFIKNSTTSLDIVQEDWSEVHFPTSYIDTQCTICCINSKATRSVLRDRQDQYWNQKSSLKNSKVAYVKVNVMIIVVTTKS